MSGTSHPLEQPNHPYIASKITKTNNIDASLFKFYAETSPEQPRPIHKMIAEKNRLQSIISVMENDNKSVRSSVVSLKKVKINLNEEKKEE